MFDRLKNMITLYKCTKSMKKGKSIQLSKVQSDLFMLFTPREDFSLLSLSDDEFLAFILDWAEEHLEDRNEGKSIREIRKDCAISLLKKHEVSMGRASSIAGMCYYDFYTLANELGIDWRWHHEDDDS